MLAPDWANLQFGSGVDDTQLLPSMVGMNPVLQSPQTFLPLTMVTLYLRQLLMYMVVVGNPLVLLYMYDEKTQVLGAQVLAGNWSQPV